MKSNIVEIKITNIKIGPRHRKDMGDLQTLAQSIRRVLMHPIGVTPKTELVFGERRLRACRDILGWESIPARVIDIPSIALGEYHENYDRKDFTPSELVAIVESLRAYKHGGDRKSDQFRNSDDDRLTTEKALGQMGLKKDTYCRAKKVVDQGVPELVEAMDSGKLSVYAASELALAKPDQQRVFLEQVPHESKWTALAVRQQLRRLSGDHADAGNGGRSGDNTETPPLLCEWIFERLDEGGVRPEIILDPSAGRGNLTGPFRESSVIAYEKALGKNFFEAEQSEYDLVLCNPPWSEAETWLPRIVEVAGKETPIVFFCPAMYFIGYADRRFRRFLESPAAPTLSHITPLPIDTFQTAHSQGVILWFNLPSVRNVALLPSRCVARHGTTTSEHDAVDQGQEQLPKERVIPVSINIDPLPMNSVTHGNCTDLIPRLADDSISLCLTSPPYAEQRKDQYSSIPACEYPKFTLRWMSALWPTLTADGSVLIVIDPHVEKGVMADYVLQTQLLLREHGWQQHKSLVWVKMNRLPLGHTGWPRHCYEEILWFSRTSKPFCDPLADGTPSDHIGANNYAHSQWTRGKKPRSGIARITDVIFAPVSNNAKGIHHPAQFPLALVEPLIKTFSPAGGTVLDPFAGSGTTLLAAANLGRKWYGFDIDAKYCDLARQRIAKQATLGKAG